MKKGLIAIVFILLFSAAQAQNDSIRVTLIRAFATRIANAFTQKDYATVARYTYPKAVQGLGGREKMIERLKASMQDMEAKGVTFRSVFIGSVSKIVKAGKELHCFVEENMVLGVKGGTLATRSYLLGVSQDAGKTWTFVDTAPLTTENITKLFPAYNKELALPAKEKPVFTPDH
jgi:hypothetical protein